MTTETQNMRAREAEVGTATFAVSDLGLSEVLEDIRILLDAGEADVDGIIAFAEPHSDRDRAAASFGSGTVLVRFVDAAGRSRVAEVTLKARWREDSCWHLRADDFGLECRDCGTELAPIPASVVFCQCEHIDHEYSRTDHRYLGVPAGTQRAMHVGPVCDSCARTHLADYLGLPAPGR